MQAFGFRIMLLTETFVCALLRGWLKKICDAVFDLSFLILYLMDQNKNDVELLRIENKDLVDKLHSLQQKRKNDYIKLTEYERDLAELKSLREFKIQLVENNTKLYRQLQKKEKELNAFAKLGQEKLAWLSEIEERLELVTVEKEMAEEKAELLQTELDIEKQHVQELEVELGVLRSKLDKAGTDLVQKQLEYQNEKLREAVVRLRDISGLLTEDKRKLVQRNETLSNESSALVKICEILKNNLAKAEQTIVMLNNQIEATAYSEQIIEMLTEKSVDLEKKISELEETVEDYEAIRTMDEEILESQKETEKELKKEIDVANNQISGLLIQMKMHGKEVDKYEEVITKFRRKIAELNEEIQEKQDEIFRLEEEVKMKEICNAMAEHSFHMTSISRTFAEIVHAEVCALELKYEIELSNYLRAFLPDNFAKHGGDADAVLLTVRLSRLPAKAQLLKKLLNHKYPLVPGGMRCEHVTQSHKAEQWAHCAKFMFLLSGLGGVVRKCESIVRQCSVERLLRLAQLQTEFAKEERIIDEYIDLLKSDKFDENTPTDGIDQAIRYFENILSVHLSSEWYDAKQMVLDTCVQFSEGLSWVKINTQRIIFFISAQVIRSSIVEYMEEILAWVVKSEQLCIRLKNFLSTEKGLVMTEELGSHLITWNETFRKVASVLDNVCSITHIQLSAVAEVGSLEESRILEAFLYSVEKEYGSLNGTDIKQNTFLARSSLMERANARKQDVLETEKLLWNLEKKENEIADLKLALRAKLVDIGNYKLRLEMAEKKIESMEKIDENEIQKLYHQNEALRDQLKKTKKEYDDTLETLQREVELCENDSVDLRNRAKTISKKVLLNAKERMRLLSGFLPITIASEICGPLTLLSTQSPEKNDLDALCKRAEGILEDLRFCQIPYVIDITQPKSKQDFDKGNYVSNIFHINERIADLKVDMYRFWNKYQQGEKLPSFFWTTSTVTSASMTFQSGKSATKLDHSKGVHSATYKNAFESLFGDLHAEQKRSHSTKIALCV
ncbi:unnamed protein product [Thelazia callipaeda]|uniref:Dynactin domain-containing protein n=1 Tax=Thelazia callipaeda TaxID=103827 RepID=A0A158RAT4_THECL|nr:unnamed protein product [Thelazia callipaeda]